LFKDVRCVYPQDKSPTVLLLGDSNGAHYIGMLREFSDQYDFTFRNLTISSCPILFTKQPLNWPLRTIQAQCQSYRNSARLEIDKYDTVIIGGAWTGYDKQGAKAFRDDMSESIEFLATKVKNVILLAKNPSFSGFNSACETRRVRMPFLVCNESRFNSSNIDHGVNNYLHRETMKYSNVKYFDARNELCHDDVCSPYLAGFPVYFDSGHYSILGSKIIGKSMIFNTNPMLSAIKNINENIN